MFRRPLYTTLLSLLAVAQLPTTPVSNLAVSPLSQSVHAPEVSYATTLSAAPALPIVQTGQPVNLTLTSSNIGASDGAFTLAAFDNTGMVQLTTPVLSAGQSTTTSLTYTPTVQGAYPLTLTLTAPDLSVVSKTLTVLAYNTFVDLLSVTPAPSYLLTGNGPVTLTVGLFNHTPVAQTAAFAVTVTNRVSNTVVYSHTSSAMIPGGYSTAAAGTLVLNGAPDGDYWVTAQLLNGGAVAVNSFGINTIFHSEIDTLPVAQPPTSTIKSPMAAGSAMDPSLAPPGNISATTRITTERILLDDFRKTGVGIPIPGGVLVTATVSATLNVSISNAAGTTVVVPPGIYDLVVMTGAIRFKGNHPWWYTPVVIDEAKSGKRYTLGMGIDMLSGGSSTALDSANYNVGRYVRIRVTDTTTLTLWAYNSEQNLLLQSVSENPQTVVTAPTALDAIWPASEIPVANTAPLAAAQPSAPAATNRFIETFIDDITGQPLRNAYLCTYLYQGVTYLEGYCNYADSSGIYTWTLTVVTTQTLVVKHVYSGYPDQYFDRVLDAAHATPVTFTLGDNYLTTRMGKTVLVNQLLDDLTGRPIMTTSGQVYVYSGTQLGYVNFTTDANGFYTATFGTLISQPVTLLHYSVLNYPNQYYDRLNYNNSSLGSVTPVTLTIGLVTRTMRLARTRVIGQLFDDLTGGPIGGQSGTLNVYTTTNNGSYVYGLGFNTDANGFYTVTLGDIVSGSYKLSFNNIPNYPNQYFDRSSTYAAAVTTTLTSGDNLLTARLTRTRIIHQLLDDVTSAPIAKAAGNVYIYNVPNAGYLSSGNFTTDAYGYYTLTFGSMISQPVYMYFYYVANYANQYVDRSPDTAHAATVTLQLGDNPGVYRLTRTRLIVTLQDTTTRLPISNTTGYVAIYTGTNYLDQTSFSTDANGVYTATFTGIYSEPLTLRHFYIAGYADQYYDRQRTTTGESTLPLQRGDNAFTLPLARTRLLGRLMDDTTGLPVSNTNSAQVYVYDAASGTQLENSYFSTDAAGYFTTSFATVITGSVKLGFTNLPGYANQYFDRAPN
ncbi:MAG TPA: hypothetical protein VGK87_10955, partial [Anaerolineae bacterium]